jgi:Fe2+ transport system protein FeoA
MGAPVFTVFIPGKIRRFPQGRRAASFKLQLRLGINLGSDSSMKLPVATPAGYAGPAEAATELSLAQVGLSQEVELVRIDLPAEEMEPLLERGILPGCRLCPVRFSPSGDPIVLVDGVLLALRKETAGCLCVRTPESGEAA